MAKKSTIEEFDLDVAGDEFDDILGVDDSAFFTDPIPEPEAVVEETEVFFDPAPVAEDDQVLATAPAARKHRSSVLAVGALILVLIAASAAVLSRGDSPQTTQTATPAKTPASTPDVATAPTVAPKRPQAEKPVRKKHRQSARSHKKKARKKAKRAKTVTTPAAAPAAPQQAAAAAPSGGYDAEFSIESAGQ